MYTCHILITSLLGPPASAFELRYQVLVGRNLDVVRKRPSEREDVGMGESVNCILLVAYVLVIWISYAQEDGESWVPIKFPSENEKSPIPRTTIENFTPRNGDSFIFTHDHDQTTSRDDNPATQDSTRNSLEVCN